MNHLTKTILSLCLLASVGTFTGGFVMAQENSQVIYRGETQTSSKGSAEYFTGDVRIDPLFPPNDTARYSGAYVTFAPSARSAWHTHPAGQHLVVIKGVCWTQTWNGTKTEAHPGDTVWCPIGVKHWHGASPDGEMTHMALTGMLDGKNVEWMEHVTDEQYYSK